MATPRPRADLTAFSLAMTAVLACTYDYDGLLGDEDSGTGGPSSSASEATTGSPSSSAADTSAGAGAGSTTSTSSSTGASSSSTGGEGGGTGGAGGGSETGGGGAGTSGTGGAGGGGVDLCGNGTIDAGEECDGGLIDVPGCTACTIDCDGDGEILDPATHHCYYLDDGDLAVMADAGRLFCEATWGGGRLLILETMGEYDFLLPSIDLQADGTWFWVGATDGSVEGTWVWADGSPLTYAFFAPPWMDSQPNGSLDDNCLVWRADTTPADEGLGDVACTGLARPFCERAPPGTP